MYRDAAESYSRIYIHVGLTCLCPGVSINEAVSGLIGLARPWVGDGPAMGARRGTQRRALVIEAAGKNDADTLASQ